MKSKSWGILATIALAALPALCVRADDVSVSATLLGQPPNPSGYPTPPYGVEPGTESMSVTFTSGTYTESYGGAFVGQINWKNASSANWNAGDNSKLQGILQTINTASSTTNGVFATYCIEGTQNVYFSSPETWTNGVVGLTDAPDNPTGGHMSPLQANELTALWDDFAGQVNYATSPSSLTTSQLTFSLPAGETETLGGDTFLDANGLATAFQIGIWEIVSDGNTDTNSTSYFTLGDFKAASMDGAYDTDILQQATSWLSTIFAQNSSTLATDASNGQYQLYALTDESIQDQIFAVPNVGGSPVPLPAALPAGLLGLSLLALLGLLRFRPKNLQFSHN